MIRSLMVAEIMVASKMSNLDLGMNKKILKKIVVREMALNQ